MRLNGLLRIQVGVLSAVLAGCATPSGAGGAAQRECKVDSHGQQVCGYHCLISPEGAVACADSPDGTCSMDAQGRVTCTHAAAPAAPTASAATVPASTAPECETVNDKAICGFHCVDAYGTRECAKTPAGACKEAFGHIVCWDPSPATLATYGAQPAECIEAFGKVSCGYHCQSAYGEVGCARTPVGHCGSDTGKVVCTDP